MARNRIVEYIFINISFPFKENRFGGVMGSVLASSAVYRWIARSIKEKEQILVVFEWSDMSTRGLLF